MIIYPDIELHNGQCVNLKHGSIEDPKVFEISPLDAAKKFEDGGAQWLHVVDLDGVFEYHGENSEIMITTFIRGLEVRRIKKGKERQKLRTKKKKK